MKKIKRRSVKLLSLLLAMATILCFAGCTAKQETQEPTSQTTQAQQQSVKEVGQGQTAFDFEVVDKDGNVKQFKVNTDKKTVGEALLDVQLIAGDSGQYGLYVKTVDGITADYDVDKTYWAFYVNGEMASTGVDATPVKAGEKYSFKVAK